MASSTGVGLARDLFSKSGLVPPTPKLLVTASRGSMGKSAGNDESVFRQVPVPGKGARVLPLEVVPVVLNFFARAPTKRYVQTSARSREPVTGTLV